MVEPPHTRHYTYIVFTFNLAHVKRERERREEGRWRRRKEQNAELEIGLRTSGLCGGAFIDYVRTRGGKGSTKKVDKGNGDSAHVMGRG